MKKFIKRNLFPALAWAFLLFVWLTIYINVNMIADAQHGFYTLGIEEIIFFLPFLILTAWKIKNKFTEKGR